MPVINTDNLKPNSHTYKNEEKKGNERERPKAVIENGVASTKKSLGQKFMGMFVKTDVDDIKSFVLRDVIVPAIGNGILDVISMAFFGETSSRSYNFKKGYTSYSSKYQSANSTRYSYGNKDHYEEDKDVDYRNIILRDRRDAERVLDEMHRRIEIYGYTTIGELFDLIGVAGKYTDNNWGWKNHDDIGLQRVSSGYLIKVTEARYVG